MNTYDPDEGMPVLEWIGAYVNTIWNEYQDYWELTDHVKNPQFSERQRNTNRKLDSVGEALRAFLFSLAPNPEARAQVRDFLDHFEIKVAEGDSARVMQALHSNPIVRDSVLLSLAFEAADGLLPTAEARAADLVALVAMRQTTARAASYLDRATHLFLWGFDPECIIMCRSVLEAALVSRLEQAINLDRPPPNLDNLIRLAGKHQILAGFHRARNRKGWAARRGTPLWQAERIKWAGNNLLHDLPAIGGRPTDLPDARTAIQVLAELLTVLFP